MRKNPFFLGVLCLVPLLFCFACQAEEEVPNERIATSILKVNQSQNFYHLPPNTFTAREMVVTRNTDGSVDVLRRDVPLSQVNEVGDLVVYDAIASPNDPDKLAVPASSIPTWFIPFDGGAPSALSTAGEDIWVHCGCRNPDGYCSGSFPDPVQGPIILRCGQVDCYGGCDASISFSVSGTQSAGLIIQAPQLNL